jgi:hypothetical protein
VAGRHRVEDDVVHLGHVQREAHRSCTHTHTHTCNHAMQLAAAPVASCATKSVGMYRCQRGRRGGIRRPSTPACQTSTAAAGDSCRSARGGAW